jgi:hypothetical protein
MQWPDANVGKPERAWPQHAVRGAICAVHRAEQVGTSGIDSIRTNSKVIIGATARVAQPR